MSSVHLAAPLRGVKVASPTVMDRSRRCITSAPTLRTVHLSGSGFSAFLAKLGPADSFIKSASYLLHGAHFAGVRKLILKYKRDYRCRTIAVFRSTISKKRNGGFRRLGITLDRSQCSQIFISPAWLSCFEVQVRLNSALDIAGARLDFQ